MPLTVTECKELGLNPLGTYTAADILRLCPGVKPRHVRELVATGRLVPIGLSGRAIYNGHDVLTALKIPVMDLPAFAETETASQRAARAEVSLRAVIGPKKKPKPKT